MGTEIERKFHVVGEGWRSAEGVLYRQGYLNSSKERIVRVRTVGDRAYLTVKGITEDVTRLEFEYEIPHADAEQMLNEISERPLIEKFRHKVEYAGMIWEVDEFLGENEGLIVAEIELLNERQSFQKPEWIGQEISGDPRYYNANLTKNPFRDW